MTMFAQKNEQNPQNIDVRATNGPIAVTVTEHYGHLRSFWSQLGHLISEIEGSSPGQRAYERYRDHSNGVSLVSGERLPEWNELDDKFRDAWTHSVGLSGH